MTGQASSSSSHRSDHRARSARGREPAPDEHSCVQVLDPAKLVDANTASWLTDKARNAIDVLRLSGAVCVQVLDDTAMAAAHLRFSNVPGTTDVLTFDLRDPAGIESGAPLDVEILICVDEARRQADARAIPLHHELLLYILHGVLHCLGHDDHDEQGHRAMHAEEDRILQAIGVGVTFAAPAHPSHGEAAA